MVRLTIRYLDENFGVARELLKFEQMSVNMPFRYDRLNETDGNDDLKQDLRAQKVDNRVLRLSLSLNSRAAIFLVVSLAISLTFNLWWILSQLSALYWDGDRTSCDVPEIQRSPYTGLAFDVPIQYSYSTEYNDDNRTHADLMWEGLNLDAMVIAPTNEWAQEVGLTDSWEFPWDPTRRKIYFLKVYHQIHCLRAIRRSFKKLGAGEATYTELSHHVEHCLDTLRQDIMCKADDTPMPSLKHFGGAGEGQVMKCKSLEKLFAWAKHPDRDACYRRLSELDPPLNTIDRYAYCEPGSQYFPVMSKYFEESEGFVERGDITRSTKKLRFEPDGLVFSV